MIRPIPVGGWPLRWVAAFAFVCAILLGTLVAVDVLA